MFLSPWQMLKRKLLRELAMRCWMKTREARNYVDVNNKVFERMVAPGSFHMSGFLLDIDDFTQMI